MLENKTLWLKVVEKNKWESESWSFYFNLNDQPLDEINYLISFLEKLNEENKKRLSDFKKGPYRETLKKWKESLSKTTLGSFMARPPRCVCAISLYEYKIVEKIGPENDRVTYMPSINIIDEKINNNKLCHIKKEFMKNKGIDPFYKGGIMDIL